MIGMISVTEERLGVFIEHVTNGDQASVVVFLDEYPAVVNEIDSVGWTPLTMAAYQGRLNIVDILLEKGAAVDLAMTGGKTPLMLAAQTGHGPVVELLLNNGADINIKDEKNRTAQTLAEENGKRDAAALLTQWPEKQRRAKASRELAAEFADFSAALKQDMPVRRPFIFSKNKGVTP